jgi:hypothetical protein
MMLRETSPAPSQVSRLERIVLLILLAAAAVSTGFVAARAAGWTPPAFRPGAMNEPGPGVQLFHEPGNSPAQLVLAFSKNCPYCMRSLENYGRITQDVHTRFPGAQVVIVSREPAAGLGPLFAAAGFAPDRIESWSSLAIPPARIPSAFVVDREGRVRRAITGYLSQEGEARLMEGLAEVAASAER